jgi:phosphate transport system substrate-binding protein
MDALIALAVAAGLSQSTMPLPTTTAPISDGSNTREAAVDALVANFPEYQILEQAPVGTVTVTGRATMSRMLSTLAEDFQELYPGVTVDVNQGGSSRGIEALKAGRCDLAAVSRELSAEEIAAIERATGKRVAVIPVGRDAVCVYVNADNPVKSLSRTQLNGIFALTHNLADSMVMRWSDIDPSLPLGGAWVTLYVLDPSHGSMQEFIRQVMPGERFQTSMCYPQPTPSAVVNACCAYPNAVGISSFLSRQPRARLVPVQMAADGPAVEPTFWTIHRGEYPMAVPLNLVALTDASGNLSPLALEWVRFMWSQSAADAVADMGGILPDPSTMPEFIRASMPKRAKSDGAAAPQAPAKPKAAPEQVPAPAK